MRITIGKLSRGGRIVTLGILGICSIVGVLWGFDILAPGVAEIMRRPEPESIPAAETQAIETHLYALESESVYLEKEFGTSGGGIQAIGEDLLVISGRGRIAVVRRDKSVEYLDERVPMNEAALESHEVRNDPGFRGVGFRVNGILLKEGRKEGDIPDGQYDLFVMHHYFAEEGVKNRLSSTTLLRREGQVTTGSPWRTIFDVDPPLELHMRLGHQSGGRMLADGRDHLLVTTGDQGMDGNILSGSYLGKVLRVEIDSGAVEVLTRGHRNPQGFARDRDGTLWVTEHGPYGGDELNVLRRGADYGWPTVTYGLTYSQKVPPGVATREAGFHDGFVQPVFAWVPSVGVSNLAVNDDRWFPLWRDDLLVTSLDGNSGAGKSIFRVRRDGAKVQYVERIRVGYSIRDITWMRDGRIVLLRAYRPELRLLSRSNRKTYCEESDSDRWIYAVGCNSAGAGTGSKAMDVREGNASDAGEAVAADVADGGEGDGARLFAVHCGRCHDPYAERHEVGPHLAGVVGRQAGEVAGWRFSSALRTLNLVWTPENLERFVANPQRFAPGTAMSSPGLSGPEVGVIVGFLVENSS